MKSSQTNHASGEAVQAVMLEVPRLGPEGVDAFRAAPELPLVQGWRENPQPEFRAGSVRLGWRPDAFCIQATLKDDCIFSRSTADQQKMWLLGDVFEIFFGARDRPEYFELHTSPAGHRLQLRFPSAATMGQIRGRQLALEDLMVAAPAFRSRVELVPGGWMVTAEVLVAGPFAPGREFRLSCGRYDYANAETEPVLSSTSRHAEINFHRQQEWTALRLVE